MKKRIITGMCLAAIALIAITQGGIILWTCTILVSILGTHEIYTIIRKKHLGLRPSILYIGVGLITGSAGFPQVQSIWQHPVTAGIVGLILAGSTWELIRKKPFFPQNLIFLHLKIILFVGATAPFILLVRSLPYGMFWLLFAEFLIWSFDTLALFGGKWVGKRPLTDISPKKTVEGTLIGIAGCTLAGTIIGKFAGLPAIPILLLSATIGVLAQLGDLHESLIKRTFDVKDSSNLLPGHGGIYDRADSTLFVLPPLYYLLLWL